MNKLIALVCHRKKEEKVLAPPTISS